MSLAYFIKLSQIVWELRPAQDFCFRGNNYIKKKVRFVSLACELPTGSPLHPYQTGADESTARTTGQAQNLSGQTHFPRLTPAGQVKKCLHCKFFKRFWYVRI